MLGANLGLLLYGDVSVMKRMKIKKKIYGTFFKNLSKIDHFHRVKKDSLVYTKRGQYLLPWKRAEKNIMF